MMTMMLAQSPWSVQAMASVKAPAVNKPIVADRATRTPHSGYHFDGTSRLFFEGWYFQVALPEAKQSFAWMYTSENPGADESVKGSTSWSSGAAQVMGANEEYLFQDAMNLKNFWGAQHELALGNTYAAKEGLAPPNFEVAPKEFWERVEEGYQVTPTWHQGCLTDNGRTDFAKTVKTMRWEYSTRPVYGWGSVGERQLATAGWLAAMPVFEPHWQICMATGLSTGWIEWGEERFEFENAPSYCEKNWGGSFPQKWFWIQCNVFDGFLGEVALTAGGGRRELPLLKNAFEDVALVCIHYQGKFYEFVPWTGKVEWEIDPWGSWKMAAQTKTHEVCVSINVWWDSLLAYLGSYFSPHNYVGLKSGILVPLVKLEATTNTRGCLLRCPTLEGFKPLCKDSFSGKLKLQMWERHENGSRGKILLDTTSSMCVVETGGAGDLWKETWIGKAIMQQPLKTLLQLPIDLDKIFNRVPTFKPPGY